MPRLQVSSISCDQGRAVRMFRRLESGIRAPADPMDRFRRFWRQPSLHYRNFQLLFGPLAYTLLVVAGFLLVAPTWSSQLVGALDRRLGGFGIGQLLERLPLFRVLAAGYLGTVGLIAFRLRRDLRHRRALLVPFVFSSAAAIPVALTGWFSYPESPLLLAVAGIAAVTAVAGAILGMLAANDIFGLRDARLVPRPVDHSGLGWMPIEQRWVESILEAAVPSTGDDDVPGMDSVDLDEFWPDYIADVPLHFRLGLRASTWLITLWPILTLQHLRTFHGLDADARDAILSGFASSDSFLLRQVAFVIKTTASFAYFRDADVQGHFASAYESE